MPEITFDQAKEFLENINPKDNVAVIHHDDGDGFCSGVLYYDWCKKQNAKVKQFTYSIGKSSLQKLNLEEFNKLIVCDLAPDFMAEQFELIENKDILYADHHPRSTPIPEKVLELVTVDQGYLPSSRTAGELTGLKPWLSLAGTVADMGDLYPENQKFIDNHLVKTNMTLEEIKKNITSVITNFLIYFNDDLNEAFNILDEIESLGEIGRLKEYSEPVENEIQKFVEEYDSKKEKIGDINFYYFEPHFSIKTPVIGILSRKNDEEIYIFASPKNNGKNISLSARNTSRKRNMGELIKAGVKNIEGNGGGHAPAAGGMILSEDLEKFKQNIKEFIGKHE
jgi:single-stranded DNA-specific DHH superfamily exonuclease